MLGIAVDPGRLFYENDDTLHQWLWCLADKVSESKRQQEEQAK